MVKKLVDPPGCVRLFHAAQGGDIIQKLLCCKARIVALLLGQIADSRLIACPHGAHILPVQGNVSGACVQIPSQNVHQRRFSCAVWSEKSVDTLTQVHADPAKRLLAAIILFQVVKAKLHFAHLSRILHFQSARRRNPPWLSTYLCPDTFR